MKLPSSFDNGFLVIGVSFRKNFLFLFVSLPVPSIYDDPEIEVPDSSH